MTKVLIFAPQTNEVIWAPVWTGSILTGKALYESGQLCSLWRVGAFFKCCLLQEQYSHQYEAKMLGCPLVARVRSAMKILCGL